MNWTKYHDPSQINPCSGPLSRLNSEGTAATGLALVRVASLSQAQMFPVAVDPNGAPMNIVAAEVSETLTRLPSGELALELGCEYGYISEITAVTNNTTLPTGTACAAAEDCISLQGTIQAPILVFEETNACAGLFNEGDQVTVGLLLHQVYGDPCEARLNDWSPSQCSDNQLVWRRGLQNGDTSIPPDESIRNPCPTTCAEKDSGDNVLDGFVIEVRDFQVGERIVFNWYLMDDNGPIAAGAPPTATDRGTLAPSAKDPMGFSFGSFQIDREATCANGDCDTMIVVTPPINDPSITCLVDVPDRNSIPFSFYVSMLTAGNDPECDLEPVLTEDEKGIERLMIRATPSQTSDSMIVTFQNLELPEQFQVNLDAGTLPPGQSFFLLDPNQIQDDQGAWHSLQGRYSMGGACLTGTVDFTNIDPIEIAIPQRGDKPTIQGGNDVAFELNTATRTYAATGDLPAALPGLSNDLTVCHILQIRDNVAGTTHILATEEGTDLQSQGNLRYKANSSAPVLEHICRYPSCSDNIVLGTNSDGGTDCQVDVAVTVAAHDDAGSFNLTNDFNQQIVPSYATQVGAGGELAQQTVYSSFQVGSAQTLTFTATDHAGNQSTRAISVQIVDDTPPEVSCFLLPLTEPPGRGGGRGNSNGGCSNRFQIVFNAEDNCDPAPTLIAASIDDIDLMAPFSGEVLNKIVTILKNDQLTVASTLPGTPNEDLRIHTPFGGVLEVTFIDSAGNTTTCTSNQSLPTILETTATGTRHSPTPF